MTAQGLFQALSALNDPTNPLYLARYALDFNLAYDNRQTTKDYAGYINGDFAFNDRLSLQAGVRYTDESKDFSQSVLNDAGKTIFLPVNPITGAVDTSNTSVPSKACSNLQQEGTFFTCTTSSKEVSPRASLNLQMTPEVFGYLQWSRGFRSGGINGRPTSVTLIQDYKPEHLDSTELGLKTLFADHRIRLNTAVFYDKYKDIQVTLTEGTTIVVQNAAKATVYGLETDLEAAVTDHWTLQGSLGYAHNEYNDWHDSLGDYTDRKLQNAPEWTANLASAYEWHVAERGRLALHRQRLLPELDVPGRGEQRGAAGTLAHAHRRGLLLSGTQRALGPGGRGQEPLRPARAQLRLQRAGVLRLCRGHLQPAAPLLADVPLSPALGSLSGSAARKRALQDLAARTPGCRVAVKHGTNVGVRCWGSSAGVVSPTATPYA